MQMSQMEVFEKFYLLCVFPFFVRVDAVVPRVSARRAACTLGRGRLSGPGHTNQNGGARLSLPDRVKYFEIKGKYIRRAFRNPYNDYRSTRYQPSLSALCKCAGKSKMDLL